MAKVGQIKMAKIELAKLGFDLFGTVVSEQVIAVPKITSQDVIPQRVVLRVPQMAEQLVDEPVPSFDDFELVEEGEEEEEEQPSWVPESALQGRCGSGAVSTVRRGSSGGSSAHPLSSGPLRRGTAPGQGGI